MWSVEGRNEGDWEEKRLFYCECFTSEDLSESFDFFTLRDGTPGAAYRTNCWRASISASYTMVRLARSTGLRSREGSCVWGVEGRSEGYWEETSDSTDRQPAKRGGLTTVQRPPQGGLCLAALAGCTGCLHWTAQAGGH